MFVAAHRLPPRPANAPPTYDDAMKYVNDAFDASLVEEPPTYSPTPTQGEEICDATPPETPTHGVSPTNTDTPISGATPSLGNVQLAGVHAETHKNSPIDLITTRDEPSGHEADAERPQLTGFEDNFVDIPLRDCGEQLPKDPPAYSYLP